jgi:hypothetical protein
VLAACVCAPRTCENEAKWNTADRGCPPLITNSSPVLNYFLGTTRPPAHGQKGLVSPPSVGSLGSRHNALIPGCASQVCFLPFPTHPAGATTAENPRMSLFPRQATRHGPQHCHRNLTGFYFYPAGSYPQAEGGGRRQACLEFRSILKWNHISPWKKQGTHTHFWQRQGWQEQGALADSIPLDCTVTAAGCICLALGTPRGCNKRILQQTREAHCTKTSAATARQVPGQPGAKATQATSECLFKYRTSSKSQRSLYSI